MRVNIYAEEITDRVEIIEKTTSDGTFTGVRFYLELPVTMASAAGGVDQVAGPFKHHPGDDDSAAVTFWGKRALHATLKRALTLLEAHYARLDDIAARERAWQSSQGGRREAFGLPPIGIDIQTLSPPRAPVVPDDIRALLLNDVDGSPVVVVHQRPTMRGAPTAMHHQRVKEPSVPKELCLDYRDGKCHSLTHMCRTCPDRRKTLPDHLQHP